MEKITFETFELYFNLGLIEIEKEFEESLKNWN